METGGSVEWVCVSGGGVSQWRQEVAWSVSVSGGGVSQWRQEVAWSGSVFLEVVLASGDRR